MSDSKFRQLFGAANDATPDNTPEKRRYGRAAIAANVIVYDGERRRSGIVANISASGALLRMGADLEGADGQPDNGRYVDLDIARVMYLGGQVVRREEDGFAVQFDLDDDECRELAHRINNPKTT